MGQIEKAEECVTKILQSQLSPLLTYHNYSHTFDVTKAAMSLAGEEGVTNENDLLLLKTAALFHDCGYSAGYENHEVSSCRIAEDKLPGLGYTEEQVRNICSLIMQTKLPSKPETLLERILCDADLDYLGRDDFWKLGDNLYKELSAMHKINSEKEWDTLQVKFLKAHHYHTKSAIEKRSSKLAEHLRTLEIKLQS